MANYLQRFLLENLDIRGAVVHLDSVWEQMISNRNYPSVVTQLLGEMSDTTLLMNDQLKHQGRLTIQLNGNGPVSLLVIDCSDQLKIRGMAKCETDVTSESPSLSDLLGDGQLVMTYDMPAKHESYQSIVPLAGNNISQIFEHYFEQSQQLSSRFFLVSTQQMILGLFLQKMPLTDQIDPDGWSRAEALAATIDDPALWNLSIDEILPRLFSQETIRVFDSQNVQYGCHENPAKVYAMLRSLGRKEVNSILKECGEVIVFDDICNREYRLNALTVDAIFREASSTIH